MQDLEYVRAYIDDLLRVTHGSFEEHIEYRQTESCLRSIKGCRTESQC
jgi:hypothetical protein